MSSSKTQRSTVAPPEDCGEPHAQVSGLVDIVEHERARRLRRWFLPIQNVLPTERESAALQGLRAIREDLSLEALLDACRSRDAEVNRVVRASLTHVLAEIAEGRDQPMDSRHLDMLRDELDACLRPAEGDTRQTEYTIALIAAIGVMGDRRHLADLRALADRRAKTRRQHRINDAARQCLPLLEARVEAMETGALLLRPSAAPTDQLLRPADLLRAADSPE